MISVGRRRDRWGTRREGCGTARLVSRLVCETSEGWQNLLMSASVKCLKKKWLTSTDQHAEHSLLLASPLPFTSFSSPPSSSVSPFFVLPVNPASPRVPPRVPAISIPPYQIGVSNIALSLMFHYSYPPAARLHNAGSVQRLGQMDARQRLTDSKTQHRRLHFPSSPISRPRFCLAAPLRGINC